MVSVQQRGPESELQQETAAALNCMAGVSNRDQTHSHGRCRKSDAATWRQLGYAPHNRRSGQQQQAVGCSGSKKPPAWQAELMSRSSHEMPA